MNHYATLLSHTSKRKIGGSYLIEFNQHCRYKGTAHFDLDLPAPPPPDIHGRMLTKPQPESTNLAISTLSIEQFTQPQWFVKKTSQPVISTHIIREPHLNQKGVHMF